MNSHTHAQSRDDEDPDLEHGKVVDDMWALNLTNYSVCAAFIRFTLHSVYTSSCTVFHVLSATGVCALESHVQNMLLFGFA